jgi:CheY-like chemotaxis protein
MGQKRALVVDDSKSARVILSRMLEKYDIEVDMAESAEQAIEYLKHGRPDAIFMDHLMPGMDGLQAVKAIKSNPQTATIPIMMYTSQEGELYVGQARALGAMGVLPKQVRPVDVSKVLYELHLLPDRREGDEPALVPVEIGPGGQVERPASAAPSTDVGRRIEAAVKQQSVDLRRFIIASLDGLASRLEADQLRAVPSSGPPPEPTPPATAPQPAQVWALAALAACLLGGMGALLWLSRADVMRTQQEIAALRASNADLKQASDRMAATLKDLAAAVAANAASPPKPADAAADGAAPDRRCGPAPIRAGSLRGAAVRPQPGRRAARCPRQARSASFPRRREGDELRRHLLSHGQRGRWFRTRGGRSAGEQMRSRRQSVRGLPVGPAARIAFIRQSGGRRTPADRRRHQCRHGKFGFTALRGPLSAA